MATMGRYCKAYPVQRFREFSGWKENAQNARTETREVNGVQTTAARTLSDDDHLYLHEDLTVTDGVFLDENIIFVDASAEWKAFCVETLKFEVPRAEVVGV